MNPKAQALNVLEALVDRMIADGKDPHAEAQRLAEAYASRAVSVRPSLNPSWPDQPRRPNTGG